MVISPGHREPLLCLTLTSRFLLVRTGCVLFQNTYNEMHFILYLKCSDSCLRVCVCVCVCVGVCVCVCVCVRVCVQPQTAIEALLIARGHGSPASINCLKS